MRFFRSLAVILHTAVFIAIGAILIILALNLLSSDDIVSAVNYLCSDPNMKLVSIIIGGILIISGLIIAQVNLGKIQMEKTIAFENPEGQVTVSLSAIEDFIKKTVKHLPEVKDMRSSVTANKKGINIICKATIFADSNIPEITEKIQGIVKSKVRDMLGIEETINIKINVIKISSKGKGEGNASGHDYEEPPSRRMPFGE